MTDVNDTNAEAFDRALSGASDGRHPEGLRPFLEMTDALRRDAEASMGRLDPATAAKQRADLMHMSETKKQEVNNEKRATAPVGDEHVIVAMPEAKEKGVEKRDARSGMPFRISTWVGGAVGVLAVAVIAIGVMMRGPVFFQKASDAGRAVSRILIPEALAGDAFMLVAEEEDAAGADIGTAFRITSKVDVTEEALRQNLRIVPPIEVDVKQMGSREFRVIPKDPLEPGKVYRLTAATVVEKSDGTTSAREFSWAVQTKDVFRVLASVPGDQSSGVPVDTAIEITMSQAGWEDPTASFSIEPKVEGRFETHGRSLVFLPAKPFEPGRIYTVTLRKGWKLAESGLGLESDAVIRFETAARASSDADRTISLMPVGAFFESAPDEDAFLNVREPYGRFTADGALVTGYALTADDAVALIRKVYAIPFWAYETGKRGDDFRPYAVTKAFEADVALERNDETYSSFLRLPGQKPGLYLILIQPTSTKPEAVSEESWAVMQVTDAATYAISDASETVLWVMNLDSQKPLSSLPVTLEGVAGQTDADGVVRLPTPAALSSTSTDGETRLAIAYVGSGEMSAVVPISRRGWWAYGYGPSGNTGASVGYLYLDRPLYRIGDTLSFFGVVQDRVTKQGASSVTVQITGSVRDYLTYRSKVYVEERVTPDEDGFFRGKLSWETMAPGSYQVTVLRDGDVVTSRMIEIRDVVKPAFTIDITPTEDQLFAGQDLTGQVRVRLFDGTPVSNKAIRLTVSGHDDNGSLEVMTDDAGIASFSFATARQTCDPAAEYTGCWDSWTDMVEARPVEAEEADIYGMAFVSLWPARLSAMTEIATKGSDATVSFLVRRVDLSAALGREERSVLTTPLSGIRLTGKVVERRWERIELGPEQSRYDIILKRVVPSYRYEIRERDVQAIDVTTGADGRATLRVPMSDGVSYRFYASATDEAGAIETVAGSFAKGWYDRWGPDGSSRGISLEPTTPRDDRPGYGMDEEVSVTFVKDGERLPDASSPSFLYVEASRGIRTVSASGRSTYAFRYRGDLIPNMTLYGVAFGPTGFQETSYSASFDTDARRLKVTVTADPATSVPSGKITATVDVRDQLGNPVKGARVAFGAVDESLLAASSMGDLVESPLTSLYGWVSDGIVASRKSHMALGEDLWMSPGYGGAEMGGGGSEAIRRTFKDTATFDVVTTDGGGRATFAFTAPDNITSWRLSAVAVTKGLSAGYDRTKLAVTKPVFVDAVVPETLLATDAPVLKIRAYGVGLATGDPITFRVDAPTLGITNAVVTGTAGTPAYVAVDRLTVGTHDVVLRVEAKGGSDALLRKVTVVPSRFTRADFVSTDLAPGTALPDIGTSPEVDVRFSSLAQSRYLPRLESLANAWNVRVESMIAERIARGLLTRFFGRTDPEDVGPLTRYQRTGGVAPLPYASEDVELSAKAAATDPDAFDAGRLAAYFWGIADDAKVSREEAIRALSGLASLGEPVLTRLRGFTVVEDLTWRERLALGRGLEAAGDREAARGVLEALLVSREERDGHIHIAVSEDRREVLEATAEAAALAASVGHPDAAGLDAYLETNWSDEALTDLDRAYYLAHVIPTLASGDVTVRYVVGGEEQTVSLVDGGTEQVTLTADEARAFRVTSVDGPASATFVRRIAQPPVSVPEIGLTREYLLPDAASADALTEGMTVTVVLTPSWTTNAQDGCYLVRDHLPSGLAPMVTLDFGWYDTGSGMSYPIEVGTQDISFVACKGQKKPITYRARVVSRGSFTAESAIMQSMVTPAVTAATVSKTIRIR